MSRLPTVGGDDNTWGDVLNDFLGVEHNADGSQKTLGLAKGGTGGTTAASARTNLGAEATANKGQPSGYAPLDSSGKVPSANLPSGSSTDPNAVHKGDLVLNVKDYGATGNGTSDDTAAIQSAIDFGQTLVSGGANAPIVYFPPGVYIISSTITWKSAHLVGAYPGNSVQLLWNGSAGGGPMIQKWSTNHPGVLTFARLANMQLAHGTNEPATFIDLTTAPGGVDKFGIIERCAFAGCTSDAIKMGGWVNCHWTDLRFDSPGGYAIRLTVPVGQSLSSFLLDRFTYDHSRSSSPGSGVFYIDCSAVGPVNVGDFKVSHGRIEVNQPWTGTKAIVGFKPGTGGTGQLSFELDEITYADSTGMSSDCLLYRDTANTTGSEVISLRNFRPNNLSLILGGTWPPQYPLAMLPVGAIENLTWNVNNNITDRLDLRAPTYAGQKVLTVRQGTDSSDRLYIDNAGNLVASGDATIAGTTITKKNPWNVKHPAWGAVGDGSTDDAAAIQAAIDDCNGSGGGVVFVPKSSNFYAVKSQIKVKEHVRLVLSSRGTEIRAVSGFPTNTAVIRIGDGVSSFVFGASLEGGLIGCNGIAGSIGVYSNQAQESCVIAPDTIQEFRDTGVLIDGSGGGQGGCADMTVSPKHVLGSASGWTYGIRINGAGPISIPQRVSVVANGAAAGTAGIMIENGSVVTIIDLHAESCTDGVKTDGTGVRVSVLIVGYSGHNTVTNGIHMLSSGVDVVRANRGGGAHLIKDDYFGTGTVDDDQISFYSSSNGVRYDQVKSYSGSPEGTIPGNPGDFYLDRTNGEAYIKHTGTGNTGWKLVTHA